MAKSLRSMAPKWASQPWYERCNQAATLLGIRGLITDEQREKIHQKLLAMLRNEVASKESRQP